MTDISPHTDLLRLQRQHEADQLALAAAADLLARLRAELQALRGKADGRSTQMV
jgi:hypothetical protein